MSQSIPADSQQLFTEAEKSALETIGTVIRFPPGSMLVREGEDTDFALYLMAGHVKVVKGAQNRIVALRGPGEIVGEIPAIIGGPRTASIFAIHEVTARHIPARDCIDFLRANASATFELLRHTERRLAQATVKSAESLLGAEQKLAKALVELTASGVGEEEAGSVALRFNQQELADIAGVSRESVVQVIRYFKAAEIVATGRHLTRLLDQAALRAIADGETTVART